MGIHYQCVDFGSDAHHLVQKLRYHIYAREESLCLPGMDHGAGTLTDFADPFALTLAALDGDAVVGTIRLAPLSCLPTEDAERCALERLSLPLDPARQCSVGRLMVLPRYRGTAVAAGLVVAARRLALEHKLEVGLLRCSPRHAHLYELLGARVIGPPSAHPEYGMLLTLVVLLRDLARLRAVQSPVLPHFADVRHCAALVRSFEARHGKSPLLGVRFRGAAQRTELLTDLARCSMPLFDDLPCAFIDRLMRTASLIPSAAGARLLSAGSKGTDLYVVRRGRVALQATGKNRHSLELGRGAFFAEESCLGANRSEFPWQAVATDDTELLSISAETLEALVPRFSQDVAEFRRRLAVGRAERLAHEAETCPHAPLNAVAESRLKVERNARSSP